MFVLVTYDVSTTTPAGRRRLRRVSRTCQDFGQRVQYSVFELNVEPDQWVDCREKLKSIIDFDTDSLRFYFLGSNWQRRVENCGAKDVPGFDEPMIV